MKLRLTTLKVAVTAALLAVSAGFATVAAEESGREEWKAPKRAARKKNPRQANAESIASGKKVFSKECASCHGESGKGDGPAAKDLTPKPRDLTDSEIQAQKDGTLFWKISNGKTPMTAFKDLLTEQQRWDVINYVRTFNSAAGNAKASATSEKTDRDPVQGMENPGDGDSAKGASAESDAPAQEGDSENTDTGNTDTGNSDAGNSDAGDCDNSDTKKDHCD